MGNIKIFHNMHTRTNVETISCKSSAASTAVGANGIVTSGVLMTRSLAQGTFIHI